MIYFLAGLIFAVIVVLLLIRKILSLIGRKVIDPSVLAAVLLKNYATASENFSSFLWKSNNLDNEITIKGNVLSTSFTIPMHLCHRNTMNGEYYLDLAGLLAISDEITTFLIVCVDQNYRPGVSVSLSGEMFKEMAMKANEVIDIKVVATKIGLTLAFTEVFFYRKGKIEEDGEFSDLLARCAHVKYLKMGFIWDLSSPLVPIIIWTVTTFPWVSKMLNKPYPSPNAGSSKNDKSTKKKGKKNKKLTSSSSTGSSDSLQSLGEKLASKSASTPSISMLLSLRTGFMVGVEGQGRSASFDLAIHKGICNFFDVLHGGAIGLVTQEAVKLYRDGMDLPQQCTRQIQISYLSAAKLSVNVVNVEVKPMSSFPLSSENVNSFRIEIREKLKSKRILVQAIVTI